MTQVGQTSAAEARGGACAVIQPQEGRHTPAGPSPLQPRRLASEQPLPAWAPSVTEDAPARRQQASPHGPRLPGVGGGRAVGESQGASIILISCKPHGVSQATWHLHVPEMAALGPEQVLPPRSPASPASLPPDLGGSGPGQAFAKLLLQLGRRPCSAAASLGL